MTKRSLAQVAAMFPGRKPSYVVVVKRPDGRLHFSTPPEKVADLLWECLRLLDDLLSADDHAEGQRLALIEKLERVLGV